LGAGGGAGARTVIVASSTGTRIFTVGDIWTRNVGSSAEAAAGADVAGTAGGEEGAFGG
jgi:hypothetical protein